MTDKGPSTAVSAILAVVVIFLALIAFFTLFSESGSQITDIFNEVFFGAQSSTEDAKQNTIEALKDLLEQVSACKYDATVNPHSANKCFCFTSAFGVISDDQYLSVQNGENTLTVTAYDTGDAPLIKQQVSYELGLFVVKESDAGKEIGCVFPDQYFIKGVDDEVENNWYVYWKQAQLNKWFWKSGEDYTFGFYGDKNEGDTGYKYYPSLRAAAQIYKISDSKYCLLTDLIETSISDTSTIDYTSVEVLESSTGEEAPALQRSPLLLFILSDSGESVEEKEDPIETFFTDSSKYCNKL